LSAPPAAGLNRQLQPSIRKSTPRRRLEADDYHAISSSATATITTTAAMKISVPLLDMRHIARRRRPIADEPPILDNPAASAAVVRCKTIKQAA